MAGYFSNLPNIYVGEVKDEILNFRLVKNIFRRVSVNEQLEKYSTLFESYYIPEGMRPDMVAKKFYGDPTLDWIILISNNVIDIYDQWPRDQETLRKYVNEKYDSPDGHHHWETNEIFYNDEIFLQSGIEVTEDFRVVLPDETTLTKNQSITAVTNLEHETYVNDKKRLIGVPIGRLVEFFELEFKDLVKYHPNSELDKSGNKKTPISSGSEFIDRFYYRRDGSVR